MDYYRHRNTLEVATGDEVRGKFITRNLATDADFLAVYWEKVIETLPPNHDPAIYDAVSTVETIGGLPTRCWSLVPAKPDLTLAELALEAERRIPFPTAWPEYRAALRAIQDGTDKVSTTLPVCPDGS